VNCLPSDTGNMAESLTTRRGSSVGISLMSPSLSSQANVTRSSSTKSKRGSSQQRKSSLTYTPTVSTPDSLNTPPLDTILEGSNGHAFGSSGSSGNSYFPAQQPGWSPRRALRNAQSYIKGFTQPTTPLLPQDKKHMSSAFGGSHRQKGLPGLLQSRWIRFLILFYTSFSVLLTITHMWSWTFQSSGSQKVFINGEWEPRRTYDSGKIFRCVFLSSGVGERTTYILKHKLSIDNTFSHLDDMTNTLKFSKIFSSSAFSIESIKPYYFRASSVPQPQDISIITHISVASWPQLERLAENWQGE
jgi:hypothetical protein